MPSAAVVGLLDPAELQAGATVLRDYLELARDPYQLYLRAPEAARRDINSTFNHYFLVEDHGKITPVLNQPFDEIREAETVWQQQQAERLLRSDKTRPLLGYVEMRDIGQSARHPCRRLFGQWLE